MRELIKSVEDWAEEKGLVKKENSYRQFCKVVEEIGEIGTALNDECEEDLIDAIGDSVVTLIILAAQNGLDFEKCLESAYNVIKDRQGKTVNGVFIKN